MANYRLVSASIAVALFATIALITEAKFFHSEDYQAREILNMGIFDKTQIRKLLDSAPLDTNICTTYTVKDILLLREQNDIAEIHGEVTETVKDCLNVIHVDDKLLQEGEEILAANLHKFIHSRLLYRCMEYDVTLAERVLEQYGNDCRGLKEAITLRYALISFFPEESYNPEYTLPESVSDELVIKYHKMNCHEKTEEEAIE